MPLSDRYEETSNTETMLLTYNYVEISLPCVTIYQNNNWCGSVSGNANSLFSSILRINPSEKI